MRVEMRDISKRFGDLLALDRVTMTIREGTVHGLVGENGAGKSTLMKILAGALEPNHGELRVDGKPVQYRSPRDALREGGGITLIAQELALEMHRTAIDNVLLGMESHRFGLIDRAQNERRYADLIERSDLAVPPHVRVGNLRNADQQKLEILRALARDARLIIMDEPTAALTVVEAERLFEIVRRLREQGTTIVYVSHSLDEVLDLADDVTVLRDGRHVSTASAKDISPDELVTAMLGRPADLAFPQRSPRPTDAPVVCEVLGLTRRPDFEDISFQVRAGEILGLAGLIGAGRSEVARAIFGADPMESGEILLDGRPLRDHRPRDAIAAGMSMLPESRKDQGLLMRRSVRENIALPHLDQLNRGGIVDRDSERRKTKAVASKVDVRGAGLEAPIQSLSGGNQQKTLFAKWLFRSPQLLIIDEPTRGVDVGAKRAIYGLIQELAGQGTGILLISSEIEEILGLCHRVLVLRNGRMMAELEGVDMTEEAVLRAAFGTAPNGAVTREGSNAYPGGHDVP